MVSHRIVKNIVKCDHIFDFYNELFPRYYRHRNKNCVNLTNLSQTHMKTNKLPKHLETIPRLHMYRVITSSNV